MEEEKAAAYYDELSRKGEGAAKFKQGLGFSATSNSNDAVPSRGSALPSAASSFLNKQAQLQSIHNKLKKKPREEDKTFSSSRVSKDRDRNSGVDYATVMEGCDKMPGPGLDFDSAASISLRLRLIALASGKIAPPPALLIGGEVMVVAATAAAETEKDSINNPRLNKILFTKLFILHKSMRD
nr:serine/Arginine-related protein 53 [Ipomoea batatas]